MPVGIAGTTAKTHLENIFSKTGVSRQSDLMRLGTGLIPPTRSKMWSSPLRTRYPIEDFPLRERRLPFVQRRTVHCDEVYHKVGSILFFSITLEG
jgi:hypothetical protein